MPNYKFHTTANFVIGLPVLCYGYSVLCRDLEDFQILGIAGCSFIFATFYLSPDLDLGHSRITRNWGPLKPLWWGYHKLFKHRGLSHSLVFSSLTRVSYLFLISVFGLILFHLISGVVAGDVLKDAVVATQDRISDSLNEAYSEVVRNKNHFLAAATGIVLSDWIHICCDRVFSTSKAILGKVGLR